MIGARVPHCLRQFHKLDKAGRRLESEQRGDGAGLEKQPVWGEKKWQTKRKTGGQIERRTEMEKETAGEIWGVADVGWHVFLTKEKKVGNSMRPQREQTEKNESLQNMG